MKSPQPITFVAALVFSGAAFFISSAFSLTPELVAVLVFVASFIAPLLGAGVSAEQTTQSNEIDNLKTLYVGNLPYRANEASVRELFSLHAEVQSVRLMKDKHTGKRRGFGFVEVAEKDADKVVEALNDSEFQQRTLKVREAKERAENND